MMQAAEIKQVDSREQLDRLLKLMVERGGSDLHLKVPSAPVIRIDGALTVQEDIPALTAGDIESVFEEITSQEQRSAFLKDLKLDFAYSIQGLARFRVNVMRQRGTIAIAFRFVPYTVPTVEDFDLPRIFKELILKPNGLILVTGPTGSGKSTTLAAMINHLNQNNRRSVVTIEDPIEFLYPDEKCIIVQQDLGDDTHSFAAALTQALRHDVDVIVIGEMRDLATVGTALRAAETGHLVLGTLHTNDAAQSIDRIIDIFPSDQHRQIRLQLSQVIEAVISQVLLPRKDGGRVAAFEIMLANSVMRRLIREEKIHEIHPNIEMGSTTGMQTMDQAMAKLVKSGVVSKEDALIKISNKTKLEKLIGSGG